MSTATALLIDPDEVRRSLANIMSPGQVTELRVLDAMTALDRWPHTEFGYFDDPAKLIDSLNTIKSAKGVYAIPNPVQPALLARAHNRMRKAAKGDSTSDKDIARRQWLLIDCDAQRPSGISANDEEHARSIARAREIYRYLKSLGWPEPIAADSGNGGHLKYRIDLPVNDNGIVQHCLEALNARFGDRGVKVDTSVFNPARIWKLYGTLACKGDSTPDRPHRMSRILSAPESLQVVSRELLESLAAEASGNSLKHKTNGQHAVGCVDGTSFDIDGFIARHSFDLAGPDTYQGGRKWTFNQSPLCDHHGDGPFLIQFATGALSAGCHHESCQWGWPELRARYEPKLPRTIDVDRPGMPDLRPDEYRDIPTAPRTIAYQRISSAELAGGSYAIEYLIDHAMVAGQPLIIAGPQKALKTSILIDAAISLETAGYFLGRLKVNRACRVAVMTGESGLGTIQESALRICDAAGVSLKDRAGLIWSPDIPKFGDRDHLAALEKFLKDDEIEVLFIDPAYLAMPSADAGNLMAQGELLRSIGQLCERMGITMVLAHHTKKFATGQDPHEPLELQAIAWAGFAEFARQWWLVNRREKYQPGTGDHRLWLSVGGSAGHSSLWALDVSEGINSDPGGRRWEVSMSDAADAREAAAERIETRRATAKQEQLEADQKAICQALASLPGQVGTKTDARNSSSLNTGRFNVAFAALLRDRQIIPTTITKGNQRSYEAYKLATN